MKHARKDYNRIQDPKSLIPEDEPVFLLRAQDVCAPLMVLEWCKMAAYFGVNSEMIKKAQQLALDMKMWQRENKVKIPDL